MLAIVIVGSIDVVVWTWMWMRVVWGGGVDMDASEWGMVLTCGWTCDAHTVNVIDTGTDLPAWPGSAIIAGYPWW